MDASLKQSIFCGQSQFRPQMNNINIHNPYYLWNVFTMDYITTSKKIYNYETDKWAGSAHIGM